MMRGLGELWARVRAAGRRDELDRDLREELAHHLELEARKLEGRGLPPAEARRAARIALGPVDAIREDDRAAWGVQWVEPFLTDVRHVIRSLAAARPFTLGVAIALAIGIGVDVTMFGIVDRLMFRAPQGLRDAERVHRVHVSWTEDGERRRVRNVEFPRLQDFVRGTQSFEVLAGLHVRRAALGRGDDTREGRIAVATASYVDLFDAPPVVGRWFTAAEDQALEGVPVAVLSHAYWMTRYGGRAEVLGERLQVDRMEATIIGVAPPGFTGVTDGGPPLVFVPMRAFAFALRGAGYATSYNWSWLELLVRRKPEVSEARANADLTQAFQASWAAARVAQETPRVVANPDPRAVLGPVQLGRGPDAPLDARVSLWMTGVALMVFAVACANVANLMLARAASRQRDVAMRLALGVSRARLLRQMVIESLGLGLLGGVGGVLLAALAGGALRTLMLPAGIDASVVGDPRTTAGAFALTIVAAALTVAVPAAMTTRLDVLGALKSGGRGATRHRTSAQAVLVVAQAALSVVLLVGAAAFVASFTGAQAHRLGLDIERLVYAEVDMRGVRLDADRVRTLAMTLETRARALPGVRAVTNAASVPFWSNEARGFAVDGVEDVRRLGRFTFQAGSADYFVATGTRILRGRAFDARDRDGAELVIVVSDGMARALWPDRDALGQCVHLLGDDGPDGREVAGPCRRVVGVAEESSMESFEPQREFTYYVPTAQYPEGLAPQFLLRIDGAPADAVATIRTALQAELPGAAYVSVVPLTDIVSPQYRAWRFGATVFAAFGGLALVLAAFGLYSLVAYEVAQREQEFGVRTALGASARQIVQLVVGRGLGLVSVGLLIGVGAAVAASGPFDALLFHQSSRDVRVLLGIGVSLLAVAALACLAPGLRAARLDPADTLRAD